MATTKSTKKKRSTKKSVEMRSFKPSPSPLPFFTLRFTQQSVYWLIFSLLILALGIWTLYLTVKIQRIYDEIQINNSSLDYKVEKQKD